MGGADWQPVRMDFREILAVLPKPMPNSAAVAAKLRKSGEFFELETLKQSWFEDDPQRTSGHGRSRARLATYLLQSHPARRRDKWADLFLRTALWMREAPPEAQLCWRDLTLVAEALANGWDLTEIGLMRDIAERTIVVLASDGHMGT
jgi:hypothetical protein